MLDAKTGLLYIILIFGGLFAYQQFSQTEVEIYDTRVASDFAGRSYVLKDGEFKPTLIRDSPYYLIYFASSDSEECQKTITRLVETYNYEVKDSDKLEFVMYSLDKNRGQAQQWAWKDKMPWPIVLDQELKEKNTKFVFKDRVPNETPYYLLIDHEGNEIGSDSNPGKLIFNLLY